MLAPEGLGEGEPRFRDERKDENVPPARQEQGVCLGQFLKEPSKMMPLEEMGLTGPETGKKLPF